MPLPDFMEILKSNAGSVSGLAKSKKYGLVGAFDSVCFSILPLSSDVRLHIAAISAAAIVTMAYLIGQSFLEGMGILAKGKEIPTDKSLDSRELGFAKKA